MSLVITDMVSLWKSAMPTNIEGPGPFIWAVIRPIRRPPGGGAQLRGARLRLQRRIERHEVAEAAELDRQPERPASKLRQLEAAVTETATPASPRALGWNGAAALPGTSGSTQRTPEDRHASLPIDAA